ncbi:MAG: peptidoglycan DD-metalloendopeptidase family protein [Bdellovibrionales bacterium]
MIAAVGAFTLTLGGAQAVDTASSGVAKERLHHIETQLDARKKEQFEIDAQTRDASESLRDLRQKLVSATEAMERKQDEATRLEDKLAELTKDSASRSAALAEEQRSLKAMTSALIELGRQPPESYLLRSGLTTAYVHRAVLLRAILPKLKERVEIVARDLLALNSVADEITEQKRLIVSAQRNLDEQRRNFDQLIKARQGLLQHSEEQKEAIARQLASLSSEAKDLRQLMEKLETRRLSPKTHAQALSAALRAPIAGKALQRYGERDEDGVVSTGVMFAGLPGAPVVAPAAGRVAFAGPFKGYGQIMILQHDGGYHSFLAGFGRIDAEMGQEVSAGEPLGVMPTFAAADKDGGKPELYFEWRRNNEPVDPATAKARF